jgi:hypothetical protein
LDDGPLRSQVNVFLDDCVAYTTATMGDRTAPGEYVTLMANEHVVIEAIGQRLRL